MTSCPCLAMKKIYIKQKTIVPQIFYIKTLILYSPRPSLPTFSLMFIAPLTFGRTMLGGGDATPLPHKVFLNFFLEDKTSTPDVFSGCSLIPRADFEMSLVMVSCYGYEILRHK